jgi:DNA polymerase-1
VAETDVIATLRELRVAEGDFIGLAVAPGFGLGLATRIGGLSVEADDAPDIVRRVEEEFGPRWVWWSSELPRVLIAARVRVARCWDIAAAHRLLYGGWRADPARVWAQLHQLDLDEMPTEVAPNLFTYAEDHGDLEDPLGPDGYMRPAWANGGWSSSVSRLAAWAELALLVAGLQQRALAALTEHPRALATARSESAAEYLSAELSVDGLPMSRAVAEELIASIVGAGPEGETDEVALREQRDARVFAHAPMGRQVDLRSPGQVRSLLQGVGIDLPDTRAWRLRELRGVHPLVEALLAWRKAERIATTYGYSWLDEHLGDDGRLRGNWTGSDGAAGRMTASSGLHNMPAEMRSAVIAEPGHVFVRADLGQIEPRVLAAVSRDNELARAAREDDMYAPVAHALAVDRATAKVAVLGAMYGQTTGDGARALKRLEAAYPVAMAYLTKADRSGQAGRDLRTYGGRRISMALGEPEAPDARRMAAARGRYGRNALVQGAAAELFKLWAVTVRARGRRFGVQIVMCLHDELLLHVPFEATDDAVRLLEDCLGEAATSWAPDSGVRFLAEVSVLSRWSDAKSDALPGDEPSQAPAL